MHLSAASQLQQVMPQNTHITDSILEGRSKERIPPPLTFTFQNLITSSPVGQGIIKEVWWQSDLNWGQEVVQKHIYLYTHTSTYIRCGQKHNLPSASVGEVKVFVLYGLTSHSTHYRSFRRRFYRSDDPTNSVIALKDESSRSRPNPTGSAH